MKLRDLNIIEKFKTYQNKNIQALQWFRAYSYRFEEYDNDAIYNDTKDFKTQEEAISYAESLDNELGFCPKVDEINYEFESFDEIDEEETTDVSLNGSWVDIEEVWSGDTYEGKDIKGSIIIEWSYEKYVGYARNLIQIGIAGQHFHRFNVESDLISGNEKSTFRSNYSVLLTAEEIKDLDKDELRELIETELNSGYWKWNSFKNNPNSANIQMQIDDICS